MASDGALALSNGYLVRLAGEDMICGPWLGSFLLILAGRNLKLVVLKTCVFLAGPDFVFGLLSLEVNSSVYSSMSGTYEQDKLYLVICFVYIIDTIS